MDVPLRESNGETDRGVGVTAKKEAKKSEGLQKEKRPSPAFFNSLIAITPNSSSSLPLRTGLLGAASETKFNSFLVPFSRLLRLCDRDVQRHRAHRRSALCALRRSGSRLARTVERSTVGTRVQIAVSSCCYTFRR